MMFGNNYYFERYFYPAMQVSNFQLYNYALSADARLNPCSRKLTLKILCDGTNVPTDTPHSQFYNLAECDGRQLSDMVFWQMIN